MTVPLVLFVLYYQLFVQSDYKQAWEVFQTSFHLEGMIYLLLCFLLMPINLGTEAFKWKKLVDFLYPISFKDSFKSVFAGLSLSIFTPKRVGDYAGRILMLKSHKKQAVTSLFVGNLSQGIANLILGLISLLFFATRFDFDLPYSTQLQYGAIGLSVIITIALLILYYNLSWLEDKLKNVEFIRKHEDAFEVIAKYDNKSLTQVLLLSFVKYVIFIVQFVLIIKAFGIEINLWWGSICASGVFFVKTLLPIPASVELATRGAIAISFFGNFTDNNIGILVASILLWVINLAIPALIGSILISKTKI